MNKENQARAFEFAKSQMPKEACGLVVVANGKEFFNPCRNISPYEGRFQIHPEDYAAAEDFGVIVEVFHSHCYGKPQPSIVDKTVCETMNLKWSIVSVPNGEWFEFVPSGYRAPLVGREWSHGHLDCYSLIRDYYKEVVKMDLPDFERTFEWWLKGDDLYAKNFENSGFRIVPYKEVQLHDILLMQVGSKVINHGGVYLGDGIFLHHAHRRLSTRQVFDGYWAKHLRHVVRHHSL